MTERGHGEAPEDPGPEKAVALALSLVNRRERTVAEVLAHLERKGVSEASAETAVRRLQEDRLIDDERFAAMFISDKRELEGWGTERIRRGLAARGLDREAVERAITDADTDADRAAGCAGAADSAEVAAVTGVPGDPDPHGPVTELDRALALLRRRFPDPPRDRRDRDRALGMLLRKGYESELAVDALAAHARAE